MMNVLIAFRSKEDHVFRLSKSIYVINFPENVGSSDLWKVCEGYGKVVDVYIPNRKSKARKRFAFVGFIRVDDIDRLVGNLCTIWIRFHLYANVVRYERVSKPVKPSGFTHTSAQDNSGSYATTVRGNVPLNIPRTPNSVSALVLDDSCAAERDLSRHVMGRVKDLNSISNLRILLTKEGSLKVKLSYLGGLWVMIEVDKVATKQNLLKHIGVNSWFHSLQDAFHDFGETMDIEDNFGSSFARKRLCIKTKQPDSILEKFKVIFKGKVTMVRAKKHFTWNPIFVEPKESVFISYDDSVQGIKSIPDGLHNSDEESEDDSDNDGGPETLFGENSPSNVRSGEMGKQHSDDPIKIYDLLNKKPTGAVHDASSSLSHPPSFTPDISQVSKGDVAANDVVKETTPLVNAQVMYSSQEVHESSNGESTAPTHSKGNSNYDFIFIESVGSSGGILCMWEASVFKKYYATISNNFIAIYGTWLPCNTKVLMVNIYAPQQPSARRVLWEYTSHLLDRWTGKAIVMGDFNDVHYIDERLGLVFNQSCVRSFDHFITSSELVDVKLEGFSFTWAHHSTSKMSKLDRFLITEGILLLYPSITAFCLDRHLSDHRPILLREITTDFGPSPFLFYHSWFSLEGFDDMDKKLQQCTARSSIKEELSVINKDLDRGQVSDDALLKRMELMRQLHDINQMEANDTFHKSKIKWAIKRDENTKFFHGIINKKRSQLLIRGVFADGICGTFPKACNSSFIALIPKVTNAKFVSDFRPISLIGCVYKVITKVLANRLAMVIPDLENGRIRICITSLIILNVFLALGLKINIQKSQVLGIGVPHSTVVQAADTIGCTVMYSQFRYLGVRVGGCMSRRSAWVDTVHKLQSRLSKWKLKTLSIGGRLTLLKSVLGASPLFNMSIFKVPKGVLKAMEAIQSLGVSSFHALNRALLLKWVWHFISQDGSLWFNVINAMYGSNLVSHSVSYSSICDEESEDDSDNDGGPETLFGENSPLNVRSGEMGKQHSDDPFKIYDLLNKQPTSVVHDASSSLSHPPGFTLDISQVSKGDVVANDVVKETTPLVNAQVIESVGSSGGILCMWEASVFKKDYATFSDNFIAIYGTWLPCNTKNGEAIVMGDFNDVYYIDERLGSVFNQSCARSFDHFITSSGLVDVKLEGFSFTWAHPSASKMSKLHRFLITEGILLIYPSITALCLDRHLSDHRPILLLEITTDFGSSPFRFYHSWFSLEGFDDMRWVKDKKLQQCIARSSIKEELSVIDKDLDRGQVSDDALLKRMEMMRQLHDINQMEAKDTFHKSKIKWAIKGDENTKFFHGIINKKRSQLSIREVFADGIWCTSLDSVKDTFKNHFEARFQQAKHDRFILNTSFNKRLSSDQVEEMDRGVSRDEIRRAIWNYGENKSPACNSSFIALIPKVTDAKFVFDFRPISLIGCVYKTNIGWPFYLNEVLNWCKRNMKQSMFFKVDFTKAYGSVRWGYLLDVLHAFGFGPNWCRWIHGSFSSAMASILVNGSPTSEFPLCCGLKQGDPLSPYLFILIMESLHMSFSRAENGLIRICITSLIFLNVFLASGLKINIQKSQVLGIGVPQSTVVQAANTIGCTVMHSQFRYLGVRVGGCMSRRSAWVDTVHKLQSWLSKWKVKTLSIGGRLTLLKSVLGASPLYNMSIFKVPKGVLKAMEAIRYVPLRDSFPRLFALDTDKDASVVVKLGTGSIASSFRREDRWICDLSGDGEFKVKVVCNFLDEMFLPSISVATRWLKCIPIKINIFAWRARRDSLLTRYDLSRRGVVLNSVLCPICGAAMEDIQHVLFRCELA
uniref:RNA-directed DNA polymerase, eukaryota n=1 Tax=Tanacetum cinerariifolium TaxID=118510 RepID=A0A6L2KY97_TANCI|nr:RNA-directed DNA polymerase, eukaryota [Tanacetum cinerariifolium]